MTIQCGVIKKYNIINELAKNDLKVILLVDSYSWVEVCFFNTAIKNVIVVDLRYTNPDFSLKEYVLKEQPDAVIVQYNANAFIEFKMYNFE